MISCAMNARREGWVAFFPPLSSFPRVFLSLLLFFFFSPAFLRINSSWEIKSMILWVFITYDSMGEVGNGIGFVMDDDQRVCDALYFCWFLFLFFFLHRLELWCLEKLLWLFSFVFVVSYGGMILIILNVRRIFIG